MSGGIRKPRFFCKHCGLGFMSRQSCEKHERNVCLERPFDVVFGAHEQESEVVEEERAAIEAAPKPPPAKPRFRQVMQSRGGATMWRRQDG